MIVVGAPRSDGELSEALSALLLSQVVNVLLQDGAKAPGGAYLVIDEAPRLAGRLHFEELVSLGRSAGIAVVLVTQDVAQFKNAEERSAILTNCNTFVACRGTSKATTDYLQGRLGERMESSVTTTDGGPGVGARHPSMSRSLASVPVLRHREISQPPFGPRTAVVQTSAVGSRPFLVDLEL